MGIISRESNDRFKKSVNCQLKRAKNNYFSEAFRNSSHDMRKSWTLIRGLMGHCKKKQDVRQLVFEGITFSDEKEIANKFNQFFTSIAEDLVANLPESDIDPISFMPPTQFNSFYLSPLSTSECLEIICDLKSTKNDLSILPV